MAQKDTPQRTFKTASGVPVERLYTEESLADFDYTRDLGEPGEAPYTRGTDPAMYRDHLWTMRQPSEPETAEQANRRFHDLLKNSETKLSVLLGKHGVTIDSLADMETLFHGIPLDKIDALLMTDGPAPMLWAMYLVVAEKQNVPWSKLRGTIQNDILQDYIAQKTHVLPLRSAMNRIVDTFEFSNRHVPEWNPILISGYQIREAGSTALQELAFTLYDGIEYVEWAIRRGLDVDAFAPRLSFLFDANSDLFEEIAKYRAARNVWHRIMTERFRCKDPHSAMLRFHTQTAGFSLTEQQPENNIVRVAIQALAAVLGGAQSVQTSPLDGNLGLRTQQILAHESGITHTADPFGGSYFLEKLTLDMERGCWEYFERLDSMGGMVAAIEQNYPQQEIRKSSFEYQEAIERKERIVVGVNEFVIPDESPREPSLFEKPVGGRQTSRDPVRVRTTLDKMREAVTRDGVNMMPSILECVRAYVNLDEICGELHAAHGAHKE